MVEKIICSGASGFVGSNLIPKLRERGFEVYCIERYLTGRYSEGALVADLNDHAKIRDIVSKLKPEYVIHLAAISPVAYSYEHYAEVLRTNFTASVNLFEACRELDPDLIQLLCAGSSEEYGVQRDFPIKETADLRPNSPYAVSKVAMDRYLQYLEEAYRFPMTLLRPFNCYDDETEILTDYGWKTFVSVQPTDKVATLNPVTDMLEYQTPTEHIIAPYEGKMIHVSGSQLDLSVTPNHRMWIRKRWNPYYEILPAESLPNWNQKRAIVFQLSADWEPINPSGNVWYNPDWIQFLAWWLSEGCLDRRPSQATIDIRQCNLNNLNDIFAICLRLGYKAHKYWYNNHDGRIRIYGDTGLFQYLRQFGKAHDKFIPYELKQLPRSLIRLFVDTYQKGDGSRGWYKGYEVRDCISSSSEMILDGLQELVLKAGWSSSKKGRFLTIARTRNEVCPRTPTNFTIEPYRGWIHCVSVPNEIIYVRRNGKPVFCGNSYGRGTNKHFVVERIISQMLREEPVVKLGDPEPIRDLMFIDDHVDAYLTCLGDEKAVHRTFNFCTGKGISIRELVGKLAYMTGYRGEVQWNTIPPRPNDIPCLIGDNSKARQLLGWSPKVNLETGLEKTIQMLRGQICQRTAVPNLCIL